MSLFDVFLDRTVKVTHEGDTRRGKLAINAGATAAEAFAAIRLSVFSLFGMSQSAAECMHVGYIDDEGDLCTLTVASIGDWALLAPEGVLRLILTKSTTASTRVDAGATCPPMELGAGLNAEPSDTAHLPSDDSMSADMDHVALREMLKSFVQKIDPNARLLARGIVQGMDPAILHNFVGFALVGKGSGKGFGQGVVGELLPLLHSIDPNALHALFLDVLDDVNGNSNNADIDGRGANDYQPQQSPLAGLLENLLAGKGFGKGAVGKGFGSACSGGLAADCPLQQNPLEGFLGTLLAAKGGKGGGTQTTSVDGPPPPHPIETMLGAFLHGNVCGKGARSTSAAPVPCATAPNSQEVGGTAASRNAFEESVSDLLAMGLVSNRQMAREMLTQHGDLSAVVAVLTDVD